MRINVTVDVPVECWAEEYGLDRSEVRADFLAWLASTLSESPVPVAVVRR